MESENFLLLKISKTFLGGVFSEERKGRDHGGMECAEYMTFQFRILVTLSFLPFYLLLLKYTLSKLKTEIEFQSSMIIRPKLIENLLGYVSCSVFFVQCVYKIQSEQLIFMFNPCHAIILVEAYLFLSDNGVIPRIIYTSLMNTLFAPWVALAFPCTVGIVGFLELKMFWVEHILAGLINPLILSICGRYYTHTTISLSNHLFSHIIFAFYQRGLLFPLSQLTYSNLNYTLCPSEDDPFEYWLGRWYYVIAELYIFIGAEVSQRIINIILKSLNYVRDILDQTRSRKEVCH